MKKELPLVSIVVPVYNVSDYVLKCLESLVTQSYNNIEILVIDDGSTDNSGEICDDFAKNDARIKVIHKKNGGLSSARNAGIKRAKGEWLCFVDSDDYVRKDFVKELYRGIAENDADVAVCGYNKDIPKAEVLTGKQATIRLLVKQENIEIIAWNKMYRKTLFWEDGIEFPDGMNYEDTLTTYKLLSVAKKVVYVSKSLYVYVEREGSITQSDDRKKKLQARELAARSAIAFLKGDVELEEAAEVSLLLAKYAFLDFAIKGEIDKKYGKDAWWWIRQNRVNYLNNSLMTRKLKLYNALNVKFGGKLYWVFRKVKH